MSHKDYMEEIKATWELSAKMEQLLKRQQGPQQMDPDLGEVVQQLQERLANAWEGWEAARQDRSLGDWESKKLSKEQVYRYRDLFDFSPIGYVVTDPNGSPIKANEAAVQLLGVPRKIFLDKPIYTFVAESDRRAFYSQMTALPMMSRLNDWEVRLVRGDGTTFRANISVVVVRSLQTPLHVLYARLHWRFYDVARREQVERALELSRHEQRMRVQERMADLELTNLRLRQEIEERTRAEKALQKSESKYRTLVESLPPEITIFQKDVNSVYVSCNRYFANLFKMTPDEVVGKTDYDFFPQKMADRFIKHDQAVMKSGHTHIREAKHINRDGRGVVLQTFKTPIKDDDGNIVGVLGIYFDVTERKRTQEELFSYQERLRSMASQLSLAEEMQRRKIAEELHDHIGQALAMSKIKLEIMQGNGGAPDEQDVLDEVLDLIRQTIQRTRSLTFELSPPVLYQLGLESALEWFTEHIQKQHGIRVEFFDDGQPKPMREEISVVLFKAVRELLLNVVKHSRATTAVVSIWREGERVRVQVQDTGVGFDVSGLAASPRGEKGFGLFSIQERLDFLGCNMKMESAAGIGTTSTLTAPLIINQWKTAEGAA